MSRKEKSDLRKVADAVFTTLDVVEVGFRAVALVKGIWDDYQAAKMQAIVNDFAFHLYGKDFSDLDESQKAEFEKKLHFIFSLVKQNHGKEAKKLEILREAGMGYKRKDVCFLF